MLQRLLVRGACVLTIAACMVACGTVLAIEPDAEPDAAVPADSGMDGPTADDSPSMSDGALLDAPADASADGVSDGGVKRVFVSKTPSVISGAFVANADILCNNEALTASLGGSYVAWLSTSTAPAPSRLSKADGVRWSLADGSLVGDLNMLQSGTILHAIDHEASGALATGNFLDVWTGTNADGGTSNSNCSDWSTASSAADATVGSYAFSTAFWTSSILLACSSAGAMAARVYCFEQ